MESNYYWSEEIEEEIRRLMETHDRAENEPKRSSTPTWSLSDFHVNNPEASSNLNQFEAQVNIRSTKRQRREPSHGSSHPAAMTSMSTAPPSIPRPRLDINTQFQQQQPPQQQIFPPNMTHVPANSRQASASRQPFGPGISARSSRQSQTTGSNVPVAMQVGNRQTRPPPLPPASNQRIGSSMTHMQQTNFVNAPGGYEQTQQPQANNQRTGLIIDGMQQRNVTNAPGGYGQTQQPPRPPPPPPPPPRANNQRMGSQIGSMQQGNFVNAPGEYEIMSQPPAPPPQRMFYPNTGPTITNMHQQNYVNTAGMSERIQQHQLPPPPPPPPLPPSLSANNRSAGLSMSSMQRRDFVNTAGRHGQVQQPPPPQQARKAYAGANVSATQQESFVNLVGGYGQVQQPSPPNRYAGMTLSDQRPNNVSNIGVGQFERTGHGDTIPNPHFAAPAGRAQSSAVTDEGQDAGVVCTAKGCGIMCRDQRALSSHLRERHRLESQEKRRQCKRCGQYFTDEQTATKHAQSCDVSGVLVLPLESVHTGLGGEQEVRYKCPLPHCEKTLHDTYLLSRHVRDVHGIHDWKPTPELKHERKYQCQFCEHTSLTAYDLHRHEQTHRPKSYVCDVCHRAYGRQDSLKAHKCKGNPKS